MQYNFNDLQLFDADSNLFVSRKNERHCRIEDKVAMLPICCHCVVSISQTSLRPRGHSYDVPAVAYDLKT